ncbi:response regulator transcription factor [Paenibacillus glacialis]|uniref:DNA-binding response regulator n=1 Tax=Paenibacillus glacialis TaxID=494026 RepID=A0A168MDK4_9BACL|nr:response regulator transcription factor [Paenibacillus glacialis]OAB44548.1 hypothetical protein PGLA_07815 [Paenibacillus glacialis]
MNEIILYVAYDTETAIAIVAALKEANYEVMKVNNNDEALKYAEIHEIDMLILDEGNEMNDYSVIREIRKSGKSVVVMILSNRMNAKDVVEAFNAGANDYITKPAQIEIVLVRIHNLFTLVSGERKGKALPITIGELTIEPKSRRVMRNSQEIHLTHKEYELLLYLARHVNEVCSREEILKQVWKYDYSLGTNVVDVYVRHLRVKLDKGFQHKMIHTSRGVGYLLEGPR